MRYPAYPAYKASGVTWLGDVPEQWDVRRGHFCIDVNRPAERLRELRVDEEVSFVPMEAVGEYGGLDLSRSVAIEDASSGYTEFQDGDVVVAKITPCFENGKGALATDLQNGVALGTTELHVLRPRDDLDRRYLFYVTISRAYRAAGEAAMYGASGQKRVSVDFVRDFPVPIPPLSEQHTIADLLDAQTARIDALVIKKRELVEKLKEKRAALISRTVTRGLPSESARAAGLDPRPRLKPSRVEWLGDVPEHWRVTRLKHVTSMIIDCPHETPIYAADGDYPVIRTADVTPGQLDLSAAYRLDEDEYLKRVRRGTLHPDDIVYGREGERWGFAALVPASPDMCLGQRMMQVRAAQRYAPAFLMWHLNADCVYRQGALDIAGATSPHVNVETIRNYWLAEAPNEEQEVIAQYLDRGTALIDNLVSKAEGVIARVEEYRIALITAAVTGKIDVRSVAVRYDPAMPEAAA